jgi:MFS family permease
VPLLAELTALDRRLWILAGARLVVTAGFSMVLPFLAMHLAIDRHVPAFVIGLIWTAAGTCAAVAQWFAGELADRIGRRPVMLASMGLRALNLAGLGFATANEAPVAVIGALCVLNAVLRALFDPVANALVADLAAPAQRVAAYSLGRVGLNVGWTLGPAIFSLAAGVPYSALFYLSVPATVVAGLGVAAIAEPPRASPSRRSFSWGEVLAFRGDRRFVIFLAATAAFFVLQVQLYQTLSIHAARHLGLARSEVGTLYVLNGAIVVCLQLSAVTWIRRLGTERALVVGCLGYAASYACAGLTSGHASLLACVAFVTLAEIVTAPAQQTMVTSLAPAGRMGAYSGLFGFFQIAGQSTGPLIGTTLLDVVPPRLAWFLLALFGVAAAAGYHAVSRAGVAIKGRT